MISHRATSRALIILTVVWASGCGHHDSRPSWAEPYNPNYQSVKAAYREVAYEIQTTTRASTNVITSFDELCRKMQRNFPGVAVSPASENPFPSLLPSRKYLRLQSWPSSMTLQQTPLLWTVISDSDQEPLILFITTAGQIASINTNDFNKLLTGALAKGAALP